MEKSMSKNELQSLIHDWLLDGPMREAEAYVKRGRRFARVPSEELRDRWIQSFRAYCRDATNDKLQTEYKDLGAELGLRQAEVPWDDVQEDIDVFTAGMDEKAAEILRDHTGLAEKWNEDFIKQLVEFVVSRKRSN